jgi:hypothetical protein
MGNEGLVFQPEPVVGAWEGAVYSRRHYYRAQRDCHMGRKLDLDIHFCEACALYLRNTPFNFPGAPDYKTTLEECPQ